MITIEDFKKLELKIAEIKEVKEHPNADKLYVIADRPSPGFSPWVVKGCERSQDFSG